eukprot:gnl/Trimastix_PCT/467.p1 GENE.gnl/Trimastix_PCT/467~~gnl/Trimastix_PCT/467.p1  ORF type:complete len:286 (+),score=11.86 gnl/Trimastix_PCT/467:123-860(+)
MPTLFLCGLDNIRQDTELIQMQLQDTVDAKLLKSHNQIKRFLDDHRTEQQVRIIISCHGGSARVSNEEQMLLHSRATQHFLQAASYVRAKGPLYVREYNQLIDMARQSHRLFTQASAADQVAHHDEILQTIFGNVISCDEIMVALQQCQPDHPMTIHLIIDSCYSWYMVSFAQTVNQHYRDNKKFTINLYTSLNGIDDQKKKYFLCRHIDDADPDYSHTPWGFTPAFFEWKMFEWLPKNDDDNDE